VSDGLTDQTTDMPTFSLRVESRLYFFAETTFTDLSLQPYSLCAIVLPKHLGLLIYLQLVR